MCKYICTSAIKTERIAINVDKWVIGGRGGTGTHLRGDLDLEGVMAYSGSYDDTEWLLYQLILYVFLWISHSCLRDQSNSSTLDCQPLFGK